MKDCFKLDSLADVLASAKGTGSSKKPEDRGGGFQKASREVNYIFGGSEAYERKRKQKPNLDSRVFSMVGGPNLV